METYKITITEMEPITKEVTEITSVILNHSEFKDFFKMNCDIGARLFIYDENRSKTVLWVRGIHNINIEFLGHI